MSKLFKIIAITLILVMAISVLGACKKKTDEYQVDTPIVEEDYETGESTTESFEPQAEEPEPEPVPITDALSGTTWLLTSSDIGNGEVSVETNEKFVFGEDGNVVLKTGGAEYSGTYTLDGNKGDAIVKVDDNKAEFDFTVDGSRLTMLIKSKGSVWKYYYTKQ